MQVPQCRPPGSMSSNSPYTYCTNSSYHRDPYRTTTSQDVDISLLIQRHVGPTSAAMGSCLYPYLEVISPNAAFTYKHNQCPSIDSDAHAGLNQSIEVWSRPRSTRRYNPCQVETAIGPLRCQDISSHVTQGAMSFSMEHPCPDGGRTIVIRFVNRIV
eukprot:763052-Hanusia_phi.AAC.2